MCGLAGAVGVASDSQWSDVLTAMADAIRHRGPDDGGTWFDSAAGVGLAHRRLSIVDLSPHGHQPMLSPSGRYVIVFNGEIYNFNELRRELAGVPWRGHSDTEVMLAAIEHFGLDAAVPRFGGMFAFALWDRQQRELSLVRDRLGKKPLYFGRSGGTFLFGSELKALRAHPSFEGSIDRDALALFMRHNYVPVPRSIYSGIEKLRPGEIVSLRVEAGAVVGELRRRAYWTFAGAVQRGQREPLDAADPDALVTLERLLQDAVRTRMIADVPLGAFLSGGIDSSLITALMQAQSAERVKTFTIGFHEGEYDEALHARAVAQHLGTDHTELYVTPQQALNVIPKLPAMFDEPFADSSQVPTYLVSQLVRQHVTVALSGDGGDEVFGGYTRYGVGRALWGKARILPFPVRSGLARATLATPAALLDGTFGWLNPALQHYQRNGRMSDKLKRAADILAYRDFASFYRGLVSHWKEPCDVVLGSQEPPTVLQECSAEIDDLNLTHRMMYLDTISYLPDDILVKVDRASMAVSLEVRAPLLDHRVLEFAWRLPLALKVRDGQGKWILRQILHKYVPQQLTERPKTGFGVPIESWLRGPLRDWAESLLDEARLRREGYLNPRPVRAKWREHLSGERSWHYYLWDVLMFQAWLEAQRAPT